MFFLLFGVLVITSSMSLIAFSDVYAKTSNTINELESPSIDQTKTGAGSLSESESNQNNIAVNPGEDGSVFGGNASFTTIDGTCTGEQVENGCQVGNEKIIFMDEGEEEIAEYKATSTYKVENDGVGYIKLDDDYTINVRLEIWEDKNNVIGNIYFDLYYHGMNPNFEIQLIDENNPTLGKEFTTTCDDSSNNLECQIRTLNSELNELASYITCYGKFPEEKYGLSDEQYTALKTGYDTYVTGPNQEFKTATGKCYAAPEDENWDGNYYPNGQEIELR